jgi:hypothetical protein
MNIEQKESGLIINEWQLGAQLNSAVHSGTRDKFNLLLSLLSDDARDFAQFTLPQEGVKGAASAKTNLCADFSLGEAQPLVAKGMSSQQAQQLNANLQENNLSSIRLQLLLANEPLLSRSEELLIDSDVKDNLTFLAQQRLDASLRRVKSLSDNAVENRDETDEPAGVNHQLMEQYQALDLDNNPIKVTYM